MISGRRGPARRRFGNITPLALQTRPEVERDAIDRRDVHRIWAWETARQVATAMAKVLKTTVDRVAPFIYSEYRDGPRPWGSAHTERDPLTVLVTTEPPSPMRDPYDSQQSMRRWERMMVALKKEPFVDDAYFDSINPAVHRVTLVVSPAS
jgi:hypothetical protein